jgi:hypothetical protein
VIDDPSQIAVFSVVRFPVRYDGDPQESYKRFVTIGHIPQQAVLVCVKATSQVALYRNDQSMMDGCVWYDCGALDCFEQDTAVQPDNLRPVRYGQISLFGERFQILGRMPSDFPERLTQAINRSRTMTGHQKRALLALISSATHK